MKKYYKYIDVLRVIACLFVLLYHLGLSKGGYLAVCTFFVMSGYFTCKSLFKNEKVSLKKYYKDRFFKIYLPLFVVVLLTIGVVSLIPNVSWFNLKPESTSALLGYNNIWQVGASLDYFSRHINSPFMHLWYISILLQFDLVFPFIFLILKKLGDKLGKIAPVVITFLVSIISTVYFYKVSLNGSTMALYYGTFTRMFSIWFGVFLGMVHHYYRPIIFNNKKLSKIIYFVYLVILIGMFVTVGYDSKYFSVAMILASLISMRLISYGTVDVNVKNETNFFGYVIKKFSDISYLVYLVQYPVIYLIQYSGLEGFKKVSLIFVLVIVISIILHIALDFKSSKYKKIRCLLIILVGCFMIYGGLKFAESKDHTSEMKALEKELEENQKLVNENQENYQKELEKEREDLDKILSELNVDKDKLMEVIKSFPIIGIGDSVMLGAINNLYEAFPNGYFDAKVSRTDYEVDDILIDLKKKNMLGEPILIHLGTNGDCNRSCKLQIMKLTEGHEVFWINTTNLDYVNEKLKKYESEFSNLHIIDWKSLSKGHDEYFYSDGIHLNPVGRKAYTEVILNELYNYYMNDYKKKQDEAIGKYEEELKSKITFYGDTLLLSVFQNFKSEFSKSNFITRDKFSYSDLMSLISESIEKKEITNRVVLMFDEDIKVSEYKEIAKMLEGKDLYVISVNNEISELSKLENVKVIKLDVKNNKDYLMADNKHLSKTGKDELTKLVSEVINNE